jgi:GNAT superfamily N-acetyltransferase
LNDYLQRTARQHIEKDLSKTYVLVEANAVSPKAVHGYFTITLCEIGSDEMPLEWARKLPQRIPAVRLGRLAVALEQQGAGLGRLLLVEAVHRVATVIGQAGGTGLAVDAKDEAVADFYAKFGFERSRATPLTLFMPAVTIRLVARGPAL